eukprot:NODE_7652_length_1561_cov_3.683403.p1 GENE.NODE_7652_length_1561_cov_3.683403~~NODE_7652_length_1561_cov_3.683403.p1  ORF type:complete len:411 (+),score=156.56 NODE_7652_length_1561_cov_3.683403:3-1235(+)
MRARCPPAAPVHRHAPPLVAHCRGASGFADVPGGRLRVVHTQLLLRSGRRTPLLPLGPEAFWRETLPNRSLLDSLAIVGTRARGVKRRRVPPAYGAVWGQVTTRGIDEAGVAGHRFCRWVLARGIADWLPEESEGDDEVDLDEHEEGNRPLPEDIVAVVAAPDRGSLLTARSAAAGLCRELPQVLVRIDDDAGMGLDLSDEAHAAAAAAAITSHEDIAELHRAQRALAVALGLTADDAEAAASSWPDVLDAVESTEAFGLVPAGTLTAATRERAFASPVAAAERLEAAGWPGMGTLLQATLAPSIAAASTAGNGALAADIERLRISALPGFSLLCWMRLLGLRTMAGTWPEPAESLVLETLVDDIGGAFVRFWRPREAWELRPRWHKDEGPARLSRLLEELQPLLPKTGW